MNDIKSRKKHKSKKNYGKRLLSLILCTALVLGMQTAPHFVLAADTTDSSAKIVVDTSAARYYHGSTAVDDSTTKSSFDKTQADATASSSMMELTASATKLTFSNASKSKPGTKIVQMAYVPFNVDIKVPAYTTRTYKITFSVDYIRNTDSGVGYFAELIEGEVPNSFNTSSGTSSTGSTKLRLYSDGGSTVGPQSVTVSATFENHTSSDKNMTKNFVFFGGHRKTGLYEPRPTFNCTLSSVTYDSSKDVYDTKMVSFDANGGSVNTSSKTVTYYESYGTLPTPTRTNYTFDGWYTAKDGGSKVESTTIVPVSAGNTLYAHWTADSYTITFDKNGGDIPSQASKSVTYDSTYGTLATVSRTGYTFDGWYTAASGGTKVTSSTKVSTAGNHTLYAHWTADKYTVTFDKNGGDTPSQASKSVTYDSTYGALATVSRTGYTFDGWYTAASGGTKVTSSTKVSTAENHTLYAHWTVNKYTITFSGAASGSESAEYTYAQTGTITFPQAVDQTSSGSFFTGWKLTTSPTTKPTVNGTAVNTSTLYQPGQALAFNGGALGNMTFTAQYTTVSGTPSTSETLTISGKASISVPPTKVTYTVKVTGNDNLKTLTIGGVTVTRSGTEDFVLTTVESGNKTVAIDGENVGSVTANGTLTVTYKTLTVTVNANKAVTLGNGPDLTRSGPVGGIYTYTHMARNPGSGSFPILVDGADTGKTVSYGGNTALEYHTATADITVQSGVSVSMVELVSDSKTLSLSASGSGQYTYTGLKGNTAYTLRVNGVSISGQTTDFSVDKSLSATIYAKTVTTKLDGVIADVPGVGDVKMDGIITVQTGIGTYLATRVGTPIGNTVSINGTDVTAANGNAAMVVNYYTVTYDTNGGSDAPVDGNTYLEGTKAAVLGQAEMGKAGCSFLGWKTGETNVGVGENVTVNGTITLTARWQENASCEVRWQTPGGELQYGTLVQALDAAGTTSDVMITVQDGKTVSLPVNHILPESAKLIVPAGTKVVSDADGAVLTVQGCIENAGSFDESIGTLHITESGKLRNAGTVLWNIKPNVGKIDNTGGTLGGEVENTDNGIVEGGTVTGTITGGMVMGPLTDEGTIKDATVTGPIDLPSGGQIIDCVVGGTVINEGGELSYTKELDGTGVVTSSGGSGTGSTPVQKLLDALGGAAVESPAGTVKLVADVDLTANPLIINDDVVIDLNGHTIIGPGGKPAIQVESGNVTIKDSSDTDSGSIIGGSGGEGQPGAPGIENKGGTVTIEGGTVTGGSGGTNGDGGVGIKNTGDGDVVVKGGEVTGGDGGFGEPGGKGGCGIENMGDGKVSVGNGKVEGGTGSNGGGNGGSGVTNIGDGTVDITGGEVTGGIGGRIGDGEGGEGGRGIESEPDKVTIALDVSVHAGEGGTGGDGTVTLRNVTPSIDVIPDQSYTGKEITPVLVVRDGADIIPVGEYAVEYKNNIEAGTAIVIVKDKPNKENALYKLAEITTTFKIKAESGTPTPSPTPGTTDNPLDPTPTPGATDNPVIPTPIPGTSTSDPDDSKQNGNDIEKRKDLSILMAAGKQNGNTGIRLTWLKRKDASGYEVYWSYCDGKRNYKKLKTVKATAKHTYTHKKLKKNCAYKYYITAYQMVNGKKKYVAKSPIIHVAMKYEKCTNAKELTLNKTKAVLSLKNKKNKKTFQIKVKVKKENSRKKLLSHVAELRYFTDDKKVAKVSRKGKITAVGKGKCTIYVIANNGLYKKIKVTVK